MKLLNSLEHRYDSSFDAYNLGDVSWTASIAGGSAIANSDSASSVTLLPSQVGQDLEIVFTPKDSSLSSCVPSVTKTLPIVANDRPLTFSENVLSTWYPCSDVSISWSSVYGEFAAGNVLVNVSLYVLLEREAREFNYFSQIIRLLLTRITVHSSITNIVHITHL